MHNTQYFTSLTNRLKLDLSLRYNTTSTTWINTPSPNSKIDQLDPPKVCIISPCFINLAISQIYINQRTPTKLQYNSNNSWNTPGSLYKIVVEIFSYDWNKYNIWRLSPLTYKVKTIVSVVTVSNNCHCSCRLFRFPVSKVESSDLIEMNDSIKIKPPAQYWRVISSMCRYFCWPLLNIYICLSLLRAG